MTAKPKPQSVFVVKPEGEMFTLYRDGEALKTPRSLPVNVPTQRLAEALLGECQGQGDRLDLRQMPLMQMTLTAIDISSHHRSEVIDGIVRYGESELVCQRATEPLDLVAEQDAAWGPYLDWVQAKFNIDLRVGVGIVPFLQKPESLAVLRGFVEQFDAFHLTGVSEAVGISGSLVLGLALVTGHAKVEAVFAAAEFDQLWQAKKWGDDPAMQGRHAEIKRELGVCVRWFELLD